MGHLVNPISLKLGVVKFWDSQFATLHTSHDYKYIVGTDYFLYKFIRGFFLLTLHMLYNYGRRQVGIGRREDGTYKHFIVNTMKHYVSHRFVLGKIKIIRSPYPSYENYRHSHHRILYVHFFDGYCESFVHQYFTSLTVSTYLRDQFLDIHKHFTYKLLILSYFFELFYAVYLFIFQKFISAREALLVNVIERLILLKKVTVPLLLPFNKRQFVFRLKERVFVSPGLRYKMILVSMLKFALGFFNIGFVTTKRGQGHMRRFLMGYTFYFKLFLRRYFYRKRKHYYRRISKVLWFYLFCFYDRSTFLQIHWRQMHITAINSGVMGRYIASRLIQRFRLGETVGPVVNDVKARDDLLGCHIKCSGRFSRRDMAVHKHYRLEKKPMNSFRGRLEFFHETIFLKNSAVSIKLWLSKKMILSSADRFYEREAVFSYTTNSYMISLNNIRLIEYLYGSRFMVKKMSAKTFKLLRSDKKKKYQSKFGSFVYVRSFYFRKRSIERKFYNLEKLKKRLNVLKSLRVYRRCSFSNFFLTRRLTRHPLFVKKRVLNF